MLGDDIGGEFVHLARHAPCLAVFAEMDTGRRDRQDAGGDANDKRCKHRKTKHFQIQ